VREEEDLKGGKNLMEGIKRRGYFCRKGEGVWETYEKLA